MRLSNKAPISISYCLSVKNIGFSKLNVSIYGRRTRPDWRVNYESVIKVLIDSIRVELQVFMCPAIPLDKFISNHAILMLKGIKIGEKNAKTHDIQQRSF